MVGSFWLRERIEAGFLAGNELEAEDAGWWPWSHTRHTLTEALGCEPRPLRRSSLLLPVESFAGRPIVQASASTGARARPVLCTSYELARSVEAHRDEGFEALVTHLATRLGVAGSRERDPLAAGLPRASTVRARHDFPLDGVRVCVFSWGGLRRHGSHEASGSVWLEREPARAAADFLPIYDAEGAAWTLTPGEVVDRFPVAPWGEQRKLIPDADARRVTNALHHPTRRALAPWLREAVGEQSCVLWWRHPSGVWGLATRDFTECFDEGITARFDFTRLTPARGPGSIDLARIDEHGERSVIASDPQQRGPLAELARRLEAAGHAMRRVEYPDE